MTSIANQSSWQRRLIGPRYDEVGSAPLWSLLYLMFLFMNWANRPWQEWIGPSVLSVIVFLPLYFLAYRSSGRRLLMCEAAIAALQTLKLEPQPQVVVALGLRITNCAPSRSSL